MLARFETEEALLPQAGEQLISSVLRASGFAVTNSGFVESDHGVDCFFETTMNDIPQRIGVDIKQSMRRPVDAQQILQALALQETGQFSRMMVISRNGFTSAARQRAVAQGLGKIDLFGPGDLGNWLSRYNSDQRSSPDKVTAIIRESMRALAQLVANDPAQLAFIEWRQLEQLLHEVFEGLGFESRLTRPGKDGGFDLELKARQNGKCETYIVEVKHWTDKKPGAPHLKRLIEVTAACAATAGVLLSTSGFTGTIYQGIVEWPVPVRLGNGDKVVSLCKTYARLSTGLWLHEVDPGDLLFAGTSRPDDTSGLA